ncbi:MAG: hypothetical protein KGQ49_02860, partial [Verrucomicrobia bacterium]|nr:hypothetical protein [Verrucomicrobiota bacterium]
MQAWVNVPELMSVLNPAFAISEEEMFGKRGAAFVGHQSFTASFPAAKKQALLDIANAFAAASNTSTRDQWLGWLRALTQDGLSDLEDLTDEHKARILKTLVFLELDAMRRSSKPITPKQLDSLVASAQALKTHVDPVYKDNPNKVWEQGSLETPEMINRILLLAVDEHKCCAVRVATGQTIDPDGKNVLILYSKQIYDTIRVHERGEEVTFKLVAALTQGKNPEAVVRKKAKYFGTEW